MECNGAGTLILWLGEAIVMNPESITPGNKISMTVAFGKQRYSTTFKQISTNIITWQDPLRMQRSTEETISIKFFSFDSSYNERLLAQLCCRFKL